MGVELGRISGPLLSDNLLRNGHNLAFETNLLFLDVNTGRIGINTDTPVRTLNINQDVKTTNIIVDTNTDIANLSFFDNKIQNVTGRIYIRPEQTSNPTVKFIENRTENLSFTNQLINNFIANSNIEITPNGIGIVKLYTTSVNIDGNLHATGSITADGILTFGDTPLDNVIFDADVNSNIIPYIDNTNDLGIPEKNWNTLYSTTTTLKNLVTNDITTNNIDLLLTQGKTIYVSINGHDTLSSGSVNYLGEYNNASEYNIGDVVSLGGLFYKRIADPINQGYSPPDLVRWLLTEVTENAGTHPHSPLRTIKQALSFATAGDEIVVFPGVYVEEFPLTVPQGVSLKGTSSSTVVVKPTVGTNNKDAFLLSGDSTVSFLTIADFYYDAVNNTGYAFKFNTNFNVIVKSPYISNVTIQTKGSVISNSDPLGFYQGDAGGGFYLDGSVKSNTYYNIPSILIATVTIQTPNQNAIWATNGVRAEFLNSYTYYAKRGIYLTSGTIGASNVIKYVNLNIPNSISLKTTTSDSFFNVSAASWEISEQGVGSLLANPSQFSSGTTITDVQGPFTNYGFDYYIVYTSAPPIVDLEPLSTVIAYDPTLVVYGAELRSINSSNTFGTYGAVADGIGCIGYLTGHSFSYIGSDNNLTPDLHAVIQANEVVAINDGQILYESVDQLGDFRVGDIFYVDQSTGQVSFNAQSINFYSNGNIVFESEDGITTINATYVQTGNIRIYDNTIESLVGPVNYFAASGTTTLNTDVHIEGLISISNDANVKGNVFLGNDIYDVVAIAPNLTQTIKPNQTNAFTLGHKGIEPKVWDTLFLTSLNVDNVTQITNNTISTLSGNNDIELVASGSGNIHVSTTDVKINNNLIVDNTLTVNGLTSLRDLSIIGNIIQTGDVDQTGDIDITGTFANHNIIITGADSYFSIPNIKMQYHTISASDTNGDITFIANGSGGVVLDNKLKITNTTISNRWSGATTDIQKSVILTTSGDASVITDTTKFIKIPVNTSSSISLTGEIRQNSSTTLYEGYNSGVLNSFTNVYSSDRKTYITPELTYGANDNTLRFVTNNNVRATIDPSKLYSNSILVDNVYFTNNIIRNNISTADIELHPTGTGHLNLNNILFKDTTIKNITDSALIISSTGTGYVKFTGTYGVVVPTGPTSDRRLTPEVGEIRNNTTLGYMEVFDGEHWIPAIGGSAAASTNDVLDLMDELSLIFG